LYCVFDGNSKTFNSWIKELDKIAFLSNFDDRKRQLCAYQYSTGLVSDYIKRYMESARYATWPELKENLTSRFSSVIDRPKAFEMLVNCRQRRDEDIQFYGERLLGLAEQAYPDQNDHTKALIESQLLTIFMSGICYTISWKFRSP